jgi:transglutaminase-like putative cysteine protease
VPGSTPVRSLQILGGDAQTRATLRIMRDVANQSLVDPAVVETAIDIVRYVDGRNTVQLARSIRAWLADRIRFLPDPLVDGDFLRTPRFLLNEIHSYGFARADCDDTATLAAALGKAAGLPARFVVLAFFDRRAPYAHVFTELETAEGWLECDVTESQSAPVRQHISRAATFTV